MEVKISYGIELEKVPEQINDMLDRINLKEVHQLLNIAKDLLKINHDNAKMSENLVDQARSKLHDIDKILNNYQMILKGFVLANEKTNGPDVQSPMTEADPDAS